MKLRKRRIITGVILISIILSVFIIIPTIKRDLFAMDAFRECARMTYENFGHEINKLNEEIDVLLKPKSKFDATHPDDYVDWSLLHLFYRANYNLEKIEYQSTQGDILFFYRDLSLLLNNLTADRKISEAENRFLRDVREFTKEVAKIHKHYLESVDYNGEEDLIAQQKQFDKHIASIYYNFFKDTNRLYNSSHYEYMRNFEGDYSKFDYDYAEKTCKALYARLIAGDPLKYDSKKDIYKRDLIFQTEPIEVEPIRLNGLPQSKNACTIHLHKESYQIEIILNSRVDLEKSIGTTSLDIKADQFAKMINKNAKRLDLNEPNKANDNNDYAISNYVYLVNPNGITDEDRNMTIQLFSNGKINYINIPPFSVSL